MVIIDWPDIVENRNIIEFHDIFDRKNQGFCNMLDTFQSFRSLLDFFKFRIIFFIFKILCLNLAAGSL